VAPISTYLCWGPRGCFRSECCTGSESMGAAGGNVPLHLPINVKQEAKQVPNSFRSPISRAASAVCHIFGTTRPENPPHQLCVLNQLYHLASSNFLESQIYFQQYQVPTAVFPFFSLKSSVRNCLSTNVFHILHSCVLSSALSSTFVKCFLLLWNAAVFPDLMFSSNFKNVDQ